MFFDLNVRENEAIAEKACQLGYEGIVQVQFSNELRSENDRKKVLKNLSILKGIEIRARNPEDLKKKVRQFRKKADIILVHGGDVKINRTAVEDPHVDIICHPYHRRRDSGINHILAKKASQNNVAIELNIRHLLKNRNNHRHYVMSQFRQLVKLHEKYRFPLIMTSGAHSPYDLRAPHDLVALASCFGMKEEVALNAISKTPKHILDHNKVRQQYIVSGVRLVNGGN